MGTRTGGDGEPSGVGGGTGFLGMAAEGNWSTVAGRCGGGGLSAVMAAIGIGGICASMVFRLLKVDMRRMPFLILV